VLPFSLIIYLLTLYKFYIKKVELDFLERLTSICFGFFGLLVFIAIFIDFLGLQIGSNLQLRFAVFFIPFSIVVIVLFSNKIFKIRKWSMFFSAIKIILCIIFLIGSLIYITEDSYFSNSWKFTDNNEKTSILWLNDNRIDSYTMWLGEANPSGSRIYFVSRLFETNLLKLQKASFEVSDISSQYLIESPIIISHSLENSWAIPNYNEYNKICSVSTNYAVYFNDRSHLPS
jgi:hypothetical protein